jgi:hypothetical protein
MMENQLLVMEPSDVNPKLAGVKTSSYEYQAIRSLKENKTTRL